MTHVIQTNPSIPPKYFTSPAAILLSLFRTLVKRCKIWSICIKCVEDTKIYLYSCHEDSISRKLYVTETYMTHTIQNGERKNEEWQLAAQPRSQGLRGETVTKTLVKFILSFQNFGEKIACAVRHNRIAITVE